MSLNLRIPKGSKLTFQEMDGNFVYLEQQSQQRLTTSSFNQFSSSYSTGSFTGSFVGDGSGLTGIPGVTPISTGSFATTGSNTFIGNQTISGSALVTGSITVPGSGNFIDALYNQPTAHSVRGNGAGLFNIIEPGEGNLTFALRRITTRDITDAITTNVTDAEDRTHRQKEAFITSGDGTKAVFKIEVTNGTVTRLTIDNTRITDPNYERLGQPINNQGIGYKPGDTLTIRSTEFDGATRPTNDLIITLREEDFDTYIGHSHLLTFDHSKSRVLNLTGSLVTSDKLTVGNNNINDALYSLVIGQDHTVDGSGRYSIVSGFQNTVNHEESKVFGAFNETGNRYQTIFGEYNLVSDIESAFIIGNGTDTSNKSNLLVAAGDTLQVTGSLDITGSATIENILTLTPRNTTPSNPESGSIISSGSGSTIKPYYWDGNSWNALY